MPFLLCRHIKTNGIQCKSPALTDAKYCFFHTRLYQRHSPFRFTPENRQQLAPGKDLELVPLEDGQSVQVALSLTINALATGQLEPSRARALLYGLSLASTNAKRIGFGPYPPCVVRTAEQTHDGISLAAPGATSD